MSIFDILTMLGGVALFLFGMEVMGKGLENLAGSKLKIILEKLTASPIKGFFLGLGVTAVIQSSAATTVTVVGFVNSGIMNLRQAIGVIMGANVGTTATAWILSLSGIEGDSLLVQLFKPTSFAPVLALLGVVLYMFCKSGKKKEFGSILIGFGVLMFGMNVMAEVGSQLKDVPGFVDLLTLFSNPLFGVIAGALLAALLQSSSASVGILQALSATGKITFGTAVPMIMGQNIGTCVTAMLSSAGAKKNAKRAAFVHLYFNLIGTVTFLVIYYAGCALINVSFENIAVTPFTIALVHTAFNLLSTALMLPFAGLLEKLAIKTVKDKPDDDRELFLDERFFTTPTFAVEQCKLHTAEMARLARDNLTIAVEQIDSFSAQDAAKIEKTEELIDNYEDKLEAYLVKLSSLQLSLDDSHDAMQLLLCIGNFERIGDHAVNILRCAKEIQSKQIKFTKEARAELGVIKAAIIEIVNMAVESFEERDLDLARRVEPLEQVVDVLKNKLRNHYLERLTKGKTNTEAGFVFNDLISDYERVADHCSNIAACLIQIEAADFGTHEYLHEVRDGANEEFVELFEQYREKYSLKKAKSSK